MATAAALAIPHSVRAAGVPPAWLEADDSALPQQQAEDDGSDGLTQAGRITAGLVVATALTALAVVVWRRTRRRRRQLAIVRPNLDKAVTQGLPNVPGMIVDKRDGEGRLIALGEGRRAYEFGSVPLRIGSATDSDVRIAASPDVAPRHAAIYMRDRKITLRHTGGSRRPTFVGGQAVDLVILDDGDEFIVGSYKFRAEVLEPQPVPEFTNLGTVEPNGPSEPRLA
jgi:hypothetical protein